MAIADHFDVRSFFVEINNVRYAKDVIDLDYRRNSYLNQYRDLKVFFREYAGEPILNCFKIYSGVKKFLSFQGIDLRFQVDHETPKKIHLFQE